MNLDQYHFRRSFYNLVELSLLAKMYVEHCLPLADGKTLDKGSLAQTLLMMKSTESKGTLDVVIHGSDPVGFLWQYEGKLISLYVAPGHRDKGVEDKFRSLMSH